MYACLIYFLCKATILQLVIYATYALSFFAFQVLSQVYFIGYLRGNAIKVNEQQFPEVFELLKVECEKLELKKVPTLWLLQAGGILNAFATRLRGQNHVILYSDVLAAAYEEGTTAVKFILGHELGHIKRNHVGWLKSLALTPAKFVPFLSWAYSRGCEYTCDNIGYTVAPEGAEKGILILAAGRDLYKKVNVKEILLAANAEKGFALWFAEIFSTHPHIVKRVANLERLKLEDGLKFYSSARVVDEPDAQASKNDRADQPPASH